MYTKYSIRIHYRCLHSPLETNKTFIMQSWLVTQSVMRWQWQKMKTGSKFSFNQKLSLQWFKLLTYIMKSSRHVCNRWVKWTHPCRLKSQACNWRTSKCIICTWLRTSINVFRSTCQFYLSFVICYRHFDDIEMLMQIKTEMSKIWRTLRCLSWSLVVMYLLIRSSAANWSWFHRLFKLWRSEQSFFADCSTTPLETLRSRSWPAWLM